MKNYLLTLIIIFLKLSEIFCENNKQVRNCIFSVINVKGSCY